jgi:hypothetical protein
MNCSSGPPAPHAQNCSAAPPGGSCAAVCAAGFTSADGGGGAPWAAFTCGAAGRWVNGSLSCVASGGGAEGKGQNGPFQRFSEVMTLGIVAAAGLLLLCAVAASLVRRRRWCCFRARDDLAGTPPRGAGFDKPLLN